MNKAIAMPAAASAPGPGIDEPSPCNPPPDFCRLGFGPDDAATLTLRSKQLCRLRAKLARCGWSVDEAANHLGVPRDMVAHLEHGDWQCFNCDMLETLDQRADRHLQRRYPD